MPVYVYHANEKEHLFARNMRKYFTLNLETGFDSLMKIWHRILILEGCITQAWYISKKEIQGLELVEKLAWLQVFSSNLINEFFIREAVLDFSYVNVSFDQQTCLWWQWFLLAFTKEKVFSKHVCAQSLRRRPRGQPPKRQRWTLKKVNNLYTSSIKGNFILWSIQTISSPRATVGTTLSWNIAEQVSLQSKVVLGKRWIIYTL